MCPEHSRTGFSYASTPGDSALEKTANRSDPKSLLRHKRAVSSLSDLCEGKFYSVIGETEAVDNEKVERLVLCAGKYTTT